MCQLCVLLAIRLPIKKYLDWMCTKRVPVKCVEYVISGRQLWVITASETKDRDF